MALNGAVQPIPFERLHKGCDRHLVKEISTHFNLSFPEVEELVAKYETPVVYNGMPLAEGVEYVKHILNTTINYGRFNAAAQRCNAPVDIVVITKEKYQEVEMRPITA